MQIYTKYLYHSPLPPVFYNNLAKCRFLFPRWEHNIPSLGINFKNSFRLQRYKNTLNTTSIYEKKLWSSLDGQCFFKDVTLFFCEQSN